MIKLSARPARGGMAARALDSQFCAIQIILSANPVTVIAARRCSFCCSVEMAGFTGDGEVGAFQWKLHCFVKRAAHDAPILRGMAAGAIGSKASLVRILVAFLAGSIDRVIADTLHGRRRSLECFQLMALRALDSRVRADERKDAARVIERGWFEAGCIVAVGAIFLELAAMLIFVAGCASHGHRLVPDRFAGPRRELAFFHLMAFVASEPHMLACERESGGCVIELSTTIRFVTLLAFLGELSHVCLHMAAAASDFKRLVNGGASFRILLMAARALNFGMRLIKRESGF